ncbi:MAG: Histone deacetylase domain protein [Methanosaeta sp. PtaB.Bin039]|nr:MAG: Histone deacetylase domain protein [Methanosaeta sp. PtaB.Bin039]OPY47559.1 MAG: Histone deacetylase domain protein [Methanosaeta sp. PtaU1.Bin028]HOT06918.1 histone deacetylase [Methanotrichaceae archaeon]HQF16460.1 histone deacetylase [Methanotrichaceae archaeon]HQI91883.1 histone deacetylase [Methanotrichaceae archaeon]
MRTEPIRDQASAEAAEQARTRDEPEASRRSSQSALVRPARSSQALKTGLIFFPAFDWAISPTHPEREERLLYTRDQIFEEGLMDLPQIEEYKPRLAELKDVARVHFCVPDVESKTTEAHLIAAGSTLVLADALMSNQIRNGFALVRPPGHHSMRVVHGNRGFCNINNEAIMVEYIRKKYGMRKIAIVDTDVHHGDGTQDIFWHDPDVLFISFHQDGRTLYPGSGFVHEMGGPAALGSTLNVPLPPGTTDEGIHFVLENLVLPILDDFGPDLVCNSAGQDNHYTDPLANMRFTAQGYARLNERLNPDMAVLEGGYAIESALPYVNTGIIQAMARLDYSHVREPDYVPGRFTQTGEMVRSIESTVNYLLNIWETKDDLISRAKEELGQFYRNRKRVFYDTDMISENQEETVRMCPDCQGYLMVGTQASQGHGRLNTALGVSIPLFACRSCQDDAREEYEEHKQDAKYDFVYLQDRPRDVYRSYHTRTRNERAY